MILELGFSALVATSSVTACGVTPATPCEHALTVALERTIGAAQKRRLQRDQCRENLRNTERVLDSTLAAQDDASGDNFLPWVISAAAAGVALGALVTALATK